jgi:TfoX/Sxy family transcriptional regulator of competence genes
MPKMTWKKSPVGLVKRFAEVLPDDPAVERRSMFGYPCAFLNGHMFAGTFQDHFILRLPDVDRTKFLKQPGVKTFEPMEGRPMKEYVVVPPAVLAADSQMQSLLRVSRAYVAGLPPRQKKAKKASKARKTPAAKKTR